MKMSYGFIASLALGAALVCGQAASLAAEDPGADLAKAPAAVQKAVKKALGENKLQEFDKLKLGEKTLYEAGFKIKDVDHSVIVNGAGEVVEETTDIDVATLPAKAAASIKRAHPDGKIDEAATATGDGKTFYDVDVKVGQDTHVVKVQADGTIIEDEIEKEVDEAPAK